MSRMERDPDIQYTMMEYSNTDNDGENLWSVAINLGDDGHLLLDISGSKQDEIDYKSVLDSLIDTLNDHTPYKFLNDLGHKGIDQFLRERKAGLQ